MPNKQVPQGNLNKLKASVTVQDFSALNVTAPFLGPAGISVTRSGVATTNLPQLTSVVTSNEPYQAVQVRINLLKTQSLSVAYEAQRKKNSVIGNITVRPDNTTGIGPMDFSQCSIGNIDTLTLNGTDAGYVVEINGVEQINSDLYS